MKKNSWKVVLVLVLLFAAGIRWFIHDVSKTSSFLRAAYTGQTDVVEQMLKDGENVEAKDPKFGGTALIYAAQQGNVPTVISLLDNHADVNATTKHGQTALLQAVSHQHWDIAKLLLLKGAKVDEKLRPGIMKALAGHPDLLKLLPVQNAQ